MTQMSNLRLADLNLNYKVKEIMETIGYSTGEYSVVDGYPNNIDLRNSLTWPIVSIEIDNMFGRDVELGASQWPACQVSIDVFSKTDGERDDISYYIWDSLNENSYDLYDFNSAFPSAVGNYSGISSLGNWGVGNLSVHNLPPETESNVSGETHHSLIDGLLYLPNL